MGCYSVNCAISGMSLYSEKAVFLPLVRSKHSDGKIDCNRQSYIVSNEGPESFFTPLAPIFGEMDGYGGLQNIEEDWNTRYLISATGRPIDQIQEIIHREQFEEETIILPCNPDTFIDCSFNIHAGMYISRASWDYIVNADHGEYGVSKNSIYEKIDLLDRHKFIENLRWINFTLFGDVNGFVRAYEFMLFEPEVIDTAVNLAMLRAGMWELGKVYAPALSGVQHGNYRFQKGFFEAMRNAAEESVLD